MKYFRKLENKHIYLSPMNPEDSELYTRWMNDLSMTINLGQAVGNFSLGKEREFVEAMAKEGHNYAIVLKESDELIGNCSLMGINHISRTAEVGLFIGDEAHKGKGYGVEALEVILAYGFKVLNLNNIMLRVFAYNERAIKAYEKVGFRPFGRRAQSIYVNGRYHDEVYMEILAGDFESPLLNDVLP
ncbi:MAG: GNAT family N-acetyltransferase [Clostridia bacterium]|nr:GNAT family N-acetyltransferase [Clostridia bacterium]